MLCDICGNDSDIFGSYSFYYGNKKSEQKNNNTTISTYEIGGHKVVNLCHSCLLAYKIKSNIRWTIFSLCCALFILGGYFIDPTMKLFFYFSIFLGVMGLLCFYSQVLWAKRAIRNNDKKYFNFIIKDSNGDISKGAEQWGVRCAIKLYSTKTKNYCTYWTPDEYKNLIKYYK